MIGAVAWYKPMVAASKERQALLWRALSRRPGSWPSYEKQSHAIKLLCYLVQITFWPLLPGDGASLKHLD